MSSDEVAKQQTATRKNHYDGECLKWIPEVKKSIALSRNFWKVLWKARRRQKNIAIMASGEK
jgi:hypothetical protein